MTALHCVLEDRRLLYKLKAVWGLIIDTQSLGLQTNVQKNLLTDTKISLQLYIK